MTTEATVDEQTKTIEELEAERAAAVENYEKLNRAHNKLKDDFRDLKTKVSEGDELHKQIAKHVDEKNRIQSEKNKALEELDNFKKEVRHKETKQLLTTKLEEAGVRAPATALRLLDMDAIKFDDKGEVVLDTITAAIESLKETDSILFAEPADTKPSTPATPKVKPAVDIVTKSAFEAEMAAAVKSGSQQQLEEVFAKYHQQ